MTCPIKTTRMKRKKKKPNFGSLLFEDFMGNILFNFHYKVSAMILCAIAYDEFDIQLFVVADCFNLHFIV